MNVLRWTAMKAVIISVGTELVTGRCVDTNAAWLAGQLVLLGISPIRNVTVGDEVEAIKSAIELALAESDVVCVSGGLGPTPDDLSRHALAEAIGQSLIEDADTLSQLEAFFDALERPMPESNKRQALVPRGCHVIPNPRGTAPGIHFRGPGAQLFALPGVPAEMKATFETYVRDLLADTRRTVCPGSARLLCYGVSEAWIGEVLADLMTVESNPTVGITASEAVIAVHVHATARDKAEAEVLVDSAAAEIRARLGHACFGIGSDTLQLAVVRLLCKRRLTIATAESCTGGLLAACMSDEPGSSAYFMRGYVVYANTAKSDLLGIPHAMLEGHGAVSEPVANEMALRCREKAGVDLAVSITGIAGPGGGDPPRKPVGLVFVGLAHDTGVIVKRVLLGSHLTRGEIRDRACKTALNLVRLHLLDVVV